MSDFLTDDGQHDAGLDGFAADDTHGSFGPFGPHGQVLDQDHDGVPEAVGFDDDGDGHPDRVFLDTNHDGTLDRTIDLDSDTASPFATN